MNGTASSFASDSENRFETLDSAADADSGYWIGFQRSQANMRGQDQPVPFDLRVTEIYRRKHDQWKLVYIATLIPSNSRRQRKTSQRSEIWAGPISCGAI
jgi:hypothetical protein